jgi:hypothetical protein
VRMLELWTGGRREEGCRGVEGRKTYFAALPGCEIHVFGFGSGSSGVLGLLRFRVECVVVTLVGVSKTWVLEKV